jgi:nitric oxide reductase subunit B
VLIAAALVLLLATLIFGLLSLTVFLYPETWASYLPFYQLRPFHVSAALFWIITGALASILVYHKENKNSGHENSMNEWSPNPTENTNNSKRISGFSLYVFVFLWLGTILMIFTAYGMKKFGGREYWEFPPVLCIPLLLSWIMLLLYFASALKTPLLKNIFKAREEPLYKWMWATGLLFFLITFLEQNLWQIPWFRNSYLREITVQWKANGSMVGAWNQMIYGTSLYLMVKLSGSNEIARGWRAYFFYLLGLTNLMFNWGHHIYNVPGASWIRDTAYIISMTEWVFLISMIQGFKNTLDTNRKLRHLVTYRFIIAAEFWVFMNLILTLAMSVPAINRYTHGTHITVAHAMGSTIGVNTMILLASFSYMLDIDSLDEKRKRIINRLNRISQASLAFFWISLIAAGVIKGYNMIDNPGMSFQEIMKPALLVLKIFSFSGIGLLLGIGGIALIYLRSVMAPVKKSIMESVIK